MKITLFLDDLRAIRIASGGLERRFSRHIKLAVQKRFFARPQRLGRGADRERRKSSAKTWKSVD
jgi:hypothetical protein